MSSDNQTRDAAMQAAGVCVWEWAHQSARLNIRSAGETAHPEICGDWTLNDFVSLLDGVSGQSLSQRLSAVDHSDRIDLPLLMASGKQLSMRGAHDLAGNAKGLAFSAHQNLTPHSDAAVEAVFQPIIQLVDGKIAGFEALARFRGVDGQLKTASQAEGLDHRLLGQDLALQMLEQSVSALEEWTRAFPDMNLFVQVNLTGADLYRAEVHELVSALLHSGRIPENSLRIELTEQMALRDFDAGVAAAMALDAAGARLILDDFGSGHSSLAWLSAIPAKGIKLDPQLTKMVGTPRTDTVLAGIAKIAHDLNMTVTAEGVEDFERVEFLRSIGCEFVQGFAYARPMERESTDRFLQSQSRLNELTM